MTTFVRQVKLLAPHLLDWRLMGFTRNDRPRSRIGYVEIFLRPKGQATFNFTSAEPMQTVTPHALTWS